MKYILIIGMLIGVHQFSSAVVQDSKTEGISELRSEIIQDLTDNILPFWMKYSPDPRGGFYGELANDGSPRMEADKGGVLNARILWTFSSAYRLLKDEKYLKLADRAQSYFLSHFVDPVYGGTYWSVKADGTPKDLEKQTYGIAYAIYGLAEHYRTTGNRVSLENAITIYHTLEKYAFDPVNGGYIESFTRDWKKPEKYGYDGTGIAAKTMNTHLHVLEAYTTLYMAWPDAGLKNQFRALINIIFDKIIDQNTWHEKLFLTMDWQNLENIDSYGHDMELSWLLLEAAEALGDEQLIEDVKRMLVNLVDTQIAEGWNPDGSMLYEKVDGKIKTDLDWWPQAESVVAFVNAWQITKNEKYLDAANKTWNWIKNNMIDREYGEWYSIVRADGTPVKNRPKASLWRCPYHNGRMGLELFKRFQYIPN